MVSWSPLLAFIASWHTITLGRECKSYYSSFDECVDVDLILINRPPFVEMKPLSKASTFSGRSRHFREHAGAITWDLKEGSASIKAYIGNIVRPVNNSTRGSRDLTKDEVKRLRLVNHGSKPGRAKAGTSKEAKVRYIARTRRAAGATPATASQRNANLGLHEERGEQFLDESTASNKDGNRENESTVVYKVS